MFLAAESIGTYESEEGAARAYDAAAVHYFGEFAALNFPGEIPTPLEEARAQARRLNDALPNRRNAKKRKDGKGSIYKGVNRVTGGSSWSAEIRTAGKRIYLGCFTLEEDAARSYDAAVLHYSGRAIGLNFPSEIPLPLEEALAKRR